MKLLILFLLLTFALPAAAAEPQDKPAEPVKPFRIITPADIDPKFETGSGKVTSYRRLIATSPCLGSAPLIVVYKTVDDSVIIDRKLARRWGRDRIKRNLRASIKGSVRATNFLNKIVGEAKCPPDIEDVRSDAYWRRLFATDVDEMPRYGIDGELLRYKGTYFGRVGGRWVPLAIKEER